MSDNKKVGSIVKSVKNAAEAVADKVPAVADKVKNIPLHVKDNVDAKVDNVKSIRKIKKREKDIKALSPIFIEDVQNGKLKHERIIRIVDWNERLDNEACKDSIGFYEISKSKDRKYPVIYTEYVSSLGLSFYPQMSESVFISDPCVPGKYIEINEYYSYMKQVRVNELAVLAQALGAKTVTVKCRYLSKSDSHAVIKANGKVGGIAKVNGRKSKKDNYSEEMEIWSSAEFKTSVFDGSPVLPERLYFRNASDITALIDMVLVNKSKLTTRTVKMNARSSFGVSLTEEASISATINEINAEAGAQFSSDMSKESSSTLEYTIVF